MGDCKTMLGFWLSPFIALIAGLGLPGYKTLNGIKATAQDDNVEHLHEILSYWLAFGLIITLEAVLGSFVAWIPLWHELKAGAFVFLSLNGAKTFTQAHLTAPASPKISPMKSN